MGQDGPIDRYIFDDFTFDLPEGLDAFAASLEQTFPDDRQPIATIMKSLRALAEVQNSFAFLSSSPPFLDMDLFAPLAAYLAKIRCSPRLRSVLGGWRQDGWACPRPNVLFSTTISPWCPISCRPGGFRGADRPWRRLLSPDSRTWAAPSSVAIRRRRFSLPGNEIQGIKLASGRVLAAPRIVAAIHPKAVLAMLPEGAVTPRHARRIMKLDDTEGLFAAHVVVDARTHPALSHNIYRLQYGPGWGSPKRCLLSVATGSGR